MPPNMKLSIIIVNWNTRDLLQKALAACIQTTVHTDYEIILIDNHSADDSVAMVRKNFPQVQVIVNDDNLGFAKANNQGMKVAGGEYIMLLNSDTICQDRAIDTLAQYLDTHADVTMVGPKLLNADRTFQHACRRRLPDPLNSFYHLFGLGKLFPRSKRFNAYKRLSDDPNVTEPVEALSGAAMMFRRKVYDTIGGLDEQFFFYGEDLDFCKRVLDRGWKTVYVHDAEIIHLGGGSSSKRRRASLINFYDTMWQYYKKHFSVQHPRVFQGIVWVGIQVRKWWALRGIK